MKPVKLKPAFKDYLWGGAKLKTDFKKESTLPIVAESWELSTHPDGESIIAQGEFAGRPLSEYIKLLGKEALGTNCGETLPILIKLIDAKDQLSIQVHPDDSYAREHEGGNGKTELWVVLDCEPDTFLYVGFEKEIAKEEFRSRTNNNTLTEVLRKVPVRPGDAFFIRAGTLHAIGAGILIAEIQQSSNVTYRVYDFGRRDASGNLRPLHVEKALAVTDITPSNCACGGEWLESPGYSVKELVQCPYFTVTQVKVKQFAEFEADASSFHALLCTGGSGSIHFEGGEEISFQKGECILIPAGCGKYRITGECEAIISKC